MLWKAGGCGGKEFDVWRIAVHIVSSDLMQLDVKLWQQQRMSENLNFIEWFMQALYKVTLSFTTESLRFPILSEYHYHLMWHLKHLWKRFFMGVCRLQTSVFNKDVSVTSRHFPTLHFLLAYSTVNWESTSVKISNLIYLNGVTSSVGKW